MNKLFLFFIYTLILTNYSYSQSDYNQLNTIISKNISQYISYYKKLHANPEISTQEFQTASFLKSEMKSLGYDIIDSLGYNSFAAMLKNGKGPTILYRTDMDGLPLLEETGVDYASKATAIKDNRNVAVMHACGHDVHMTTWLALAQILKQTKNQWSGTIVFLAQSAEETGQGAKKVVAAEHFNSLPKADYNIAIHNHAELEAGTIGFCNSYAMAAVDMMSITIFGKGGHGAAPEKCIDPIVLSAQFITAIQTIISRNLSSNDPALITVGAIHGGNAGNVIPEKVELKLTIRTYSDSSRKLILKRIKEIGDHLALAAGLAEDKLPVYDLGDMSIPSVYNSPQLGESLSSFAKAQFGNHAITEVKPVMIGEDFGVYGQQASKIPSYLMWTGTVAQKRKAKALHDASVTPSLHSSHFAPDIEETLTKNIPIIAGCLYHLFNSKTKTIQ